MKIITLNCANYDDHPDWIVRKSMIADEIAQTLPNVVCFQEIRFDPKQAPTNVDYLNMGEQVVIELNSKGIMFEVFFSNAQYYNPFNLVPSLKPTSVYEGLSILTMHDHSNSEKKLSTVYLPIVANGDLNKRITQYIVLTDVDLNQEINVFNVHFSFDETNLQSNVTITLDYCSKFKRNIIVGDFNSLYNQISEYFVDAGYTDLWLSMNPNDSGFTFPSNAPTERIDYCWISADLMELYSTKQISTILASPNASGVYASDHLGLYIELTNKQMD